MQNTVNLYFKITVEWKWVDNEMFMNVSEQQ